MARLFTAYVTVDWSAASTKKTGADSIWVGVLKRDIRFRPTFEAFNPATRREAEALLREVLADLKGRNDRALVGFDFALGYPAGTAERLQLDAEPARRWAATWRYLERGIVDKPDNLNNRATVAARMNRTMTDGPRPFWGAPRPGDANTMLSKTKPADHTAGLPEFRETERRTQGRGKAGAKPVWQLTGNGSVGSQALMGIPAVKRLADELGERGAVWPFTTGWRAPSPSELAGLDAVVAEVYPALVPTMPQPGETPADRVQVRTLCEHWSKLDEAGRLAPLFAAPKDASPELVEAVEGEEGWILGVS